LGEGGGDQGLLSCAPTCNTEFGDVSEAAGLATVQSVFITSAYGQACYLAALLITCAPGVVRQLLLRFIFTYVADLKGQGIFDSTVMGSRSEFGLTVASNGEGTNHALAGNHFVLGGGISGGTIFNDFSESLLEGNDLDAGHGRLIPKYPLEGVMAPIAEWMGADPSSGNASVFPKLANFSSSEHIIDKTKLFNNYYLV